MHQFYHEQQKNNNNKAWIVIKIITENINSIELKEEKNTTK